MHFSKSPRLVWPAAALAIAISIPAADADVPLYNFTIGMSGGLEYFHLRELNSSDTRLLSESGNRYVITGFLDNRDRYDPDAAWHYHLEAAAYGGQVDYDGQSQSVDPLQNNLPFTSQTDYQGGRGEALLGYRLQSGILILPLELLGGVGFDGWGRQIQNGTTGNGTPVSGIKEDYRVYYGKLALGMTDLFSGKWHNRLLVGLKRPFKVNEDVSLRAVGYDSDVTLSPGNSFSGFAKLTLESRPNEGRTGNLLVNIYYEGYRFASSPSKTVTRSGNPVLVGQPQTRVDSFGLQAGYRF